MSDQLLEQKHNAGAYGLAYGIWFLTALLSVIVFTAGRSVIVRTYTRFFPWDAWLIQAGQGSLSLINILISLPLAMLVIAIIIGGFEYQHRNMGTPNGWRMLARTLAVEAGFLLLALYL
jgi:hypothetical protein